LSLSDNPDTSCERADNIASRQREEVEQRLKVLQKELKRHGARIAATAASATAGSSK